MKRRGPPVGRASAFVVLVLLSGLVACSGDPQEVSLANSPGDLAGLSQQVAVQGTRIAALETSVALILPTATLPPAPTPTIVPPVAGLVIEGTTKGAAGAAVTITEFTDYLCPYCARHAVSTARTIDEEYVRTGQVRVVAKHLPVHGAQAAKAAEAALCASDQGRFWDYHDGLMESLYTGDPAARSAERLAQLASDLRLDGAAFGACLDGAKYAGQVQEDIAEAQRLGINGTPTFLVNDTAIVGAQPFEVFRATILAALGAD